MAIQNPKGPHHVEHETGGTDALAALSAAVITTGVLPAARGGTGVATGLSAIDGASITTGTVADARLSANVALLNANNTLTGINNVTANPPTFDLIDSSQPVGSKMTRFWANAGNSAIYSISEVNGTPAGGLINLTLDRLGNIKVGGDLYEKGRTTPMGHWIDFTAVLGGATLTSTTCCRYAILGKTLKMSFWLAITVTGTPSSITLALPAGLTAAIQQCVGAGFSNIYVPNPLFINALPGGTVINILKDINGSAHTTGPHSIAGTATVSLT